ncbi:hypothetical protein OAQ98_03090 [Alphaproteobacteria bacterium]|nr:hypothetical protein [Alphaproteobacteria bacterium]
MQKVRIPQNSFQYGEISDNTIMRTDSPIYAASAQSLENMIVLPEGAVKKRHGTKFIYKNTRTNKDLHLAPFIFDDNEQYVIGIGEAYIFCWRLLTDGTVSLVSTITADTQNNVLPFDKDYLRQYNTAQYGDVMFICHPLFAPRMLTRTSLTAFELSVFSFDTSYDNKDTYQPYSSFYSTNVTLSSSNPATGSNRTITTSAPYWDTTGKHIGVTVRYGGNEIVITSVNSTTQAIGTVVKELSTRLTVTNPLRTRNGSSTIEITHLSHGLIVGSALTISDAVAVGGINASSINGSRTVVEILDINTYTVNASANANESEDGGGFVKITSNSATTNWDEQAFSALRGYPASVTFHENRLCFGGTLAEPDTIWMSSLGEFFDYNVGEGEDTDAINLVAATGDVNEIRYMRSNRDLQIFTLSDELYVPTYLNQAITPTNAQIRKQTPFGSEFVLPTSIDGATIFVERGGRAIREYIYSDAEDAYISTAISTVATHLIKTPVDIAVVHSGFNTAESYAALVMADGDMALFSSNRAEKRAAWTGLTSQGSYKATTAIGDRLFTYQQDVNNNYVLSEFLDDIGLDNYLYVAYGSGTVSVSSLYSSGTVDVIGYDGTNKVYLGEFTVTSGNITMTGHSSYTHFYVGKKYTSKIITNPIDTVAANGPVTGDVRGISTVVLNLKDSESIKVNNRAVNNITGFKGNKEVRLLGYSRSPQVTIEQEEPMPLQINGLISELIT